jgi:hypothetical protein
MRKTAYQAAVALFAIAALIYGRPVSFPDNVHTSHGLPLTWGVHQLVTIVGPVDTWTVNLVNLTLDIAFWFGLVLMSPVITERFTSK